MLKHPFTRFITHHKLLHNRDKISSSFLTIGINNSSRNFIGTCSKHQDEKAQTKAVLAERERLKQRQINFEKRLKELDDAALASIPVEITTPITKTFEQRLKELEKTSPNLKSKVPKWLKEHGPRHPTPYSIFIRECWKTASEKYLQNKEYYDELFPNFATRNNLMLSKILSIIWKDMGTEERKVYYDIHAEIKRTNPLAVKDSDKPEWKKIKRPRTAFLHFKMDIFKSVKQQFTTYNIQQLNYIISEMYKKLPEDKMEHYRGLCSKERSQYYKLKEEVLSKNQTQKPETPVQQPVVEELEEEEADEYETDEFY